MTTRAAALAAMERLRAYTLAHELRSQDVQIIQDYLVSIPEPAVRATWEDDYDPRDL